MARRGPDGGFSHWGRRALAWKDRLPEGQVVEVFPSGWPVNTAHARHYLKHFHETYLPRKGVCKVHLVETEERRWARQLWQETMEDSTFSLQGFLAPWQHDVLLAKADPDAALSPYLHFRLEEQVSRWHLISGGQVQACGSDEGLSSQRLLAQLADYLRRAAALEVGPAALRSLVLASRADLPGGQAPALTLLVAGRQLHSGLPTRQTFAWSEFLAGKPSFLQAWHRVRRRIFQQAEEVTGPLGKGREGLDLPGWRVLTSGDLSSLFVEGPVVKLMDETL